VGRNGNIKCAYFQLAKKHQFTISNMNPVKSYIYNHEGQEREILLYLHESLTQRFGMNYRLRYRVPFYDVSRWLFYLNPQKKNGIELCFLHGRRMNDQNGVLESRYMA